MSTDNSTNAPQSTDFIREIIREDNRTGKHGGRVQYPVPAGAERLSAHRPRQVDLPELRHRPASSAGCATCGSTTPTPARRTSSTSIRSWRTSAGWASIGRTGCIYASDYFEQIYEWAVQLIKAGKAYVCDLTADQVRETRGTLTEPGKNSPYRNRSIEENLDLFERMRAGEFPDGSQTLRAKIDMASPNLNMRDPVMYRILHATHHRTGDKWCIYPMYDFTHGQSDSIERITHSICTLEFENHRPLYDWYIRELGIFAPQQIEFARLNLTYTVMSKRRLLELVKEGYVSGWDDPRMPTICGLRRRGYTPEAIRDFCATHRRVEGR